MIGSLIFQVVGNDKIDVMQADNDERYKLNKLIDELVINNYFEYIKPKLGFESIFRLSASISL